MTDAELEAKEVFEDVNATFDRDVCIKKIEKALQQAEQRGSGEHYTRGVFDGGQRAWKEGLLRAAEKVDKWHIKKGGYGILAEAIRKEAEK